MNTKFAIVSCALALASCVGASSQLDWAYAQPTLVSGSTPLSSPGLSYTAQSSLGSLKLRRFAVPVQASKELALEYRQKGERIYFQHSARAAMVWLDKAIALDPFDAESHLLKGAALVAVYKFDEGIASFNRSIEISPQSGKAYCNRARAWPLTRDLIGDRQGVLEDLNEDIRRNPKHADAYFFRASLAKNLADTLMDLETAARLEPQSIKFLRRLATAQWLAGRNKDTLMTYNKLIAKCQNADSYRERGMVKFALKDNAGALFDFDQSIKLGGDCFAMRGIARARNGDHLGAMIDQYGATICRFKGPFRNFLTDLLNCKALPKLPQLP